MIFPVGKMTLEFGENWQIHSSMSLGFFKIYFSPEIVANFKLVEIRPTAELCELPLILLLCSFASKPLCKILDLSKIIPILKIIFFK